MNHSFLEKKIMNNLSQKLELEHLESNMLLYKELDSESKEIEKRMEELRTKNLLIMKNLELKSHEFNNLKIYISSNSKKIGVNELELIKIIGEDKTNSLKEVSIPKLVAAIKDKIIPKSAESTILTIKGSEFVTIRTTIEKPEISL